MNNSIEGKNYFPRKVDTFFRKIKIYFETHSNHMRAKKGKITLLKVFYFLGWFFFGLFEMEDAVIRIPSQYIPAEFSQVIFRENFGPNKGWEKGI